MKHTSLLLPVFLLPFVCGAQILAQKLAAAYSAFESDPQLQFATSSLYITDARTGAVVFSRNADKGLAPASTQKIITSVTALELLGQDFRFVTRLGIDGRLQHGTLEGNLVIRGSGDPTLGSERWSSTEPDRVLHTWVEQVTGGGINTINGTVVADTAGRSFMPVPDGWIWQDIGNYYGAGSYPLNWKENQYDLVLQSGSSVGSRVVVTANGSGYGFDNNLRAAPKGTGDNAYIYYDHSLRGTIPVSEKAFTISGASLNPAGDLVRDFTQALEQGGIYCHGQTKVADPGTSATEPSWLYTWYSPRLDSIIYWLNRKSINLYAEALIRALAQQGGGTPSTRRGLDLVRNFWKQHGVDPNELNLYDGSGLSPMNRVTTHAQVSVLAWAHARRWFPVFYESLPEYNGMKMKSGTIGDVKGFAGYHRSRSGREYIFSFLVNNYNGSSATLVRKMYHVLDLLK